MSNNDKMYAPYSRDSKIFTLVRDIDESGKCAIGVIGADGMHVAQSGAEWRRG